MKLELWLDESGDFQNDQNVKFNPSLVGGVLLREKVINENDAENILGKSYVHFTSELGRVQHPHIGNSPGKRGRICFFSKCGTSYYH